MTARPARVLIRARKPCFLYLLLTFGWNGRFMGPPSRSHRHDTRPRLPGSAMLWMNMAATLNGRGRSRRRQPRGQAVEKLAARCRQRAPKAFRPAPRRERQICDTYYSTVFQGAFIVVEVTVRGLGALRLARRRGAATFALPSQRPGAGAFAANRRPSCDSHCPHLWINVWRKERRR